MRCTPVALLTVLVCHASAQEVVRSMLRLPDTGQSSSFITSFGEDADYSINVPSFEVNGDGTVLDTVTGLMWQQADGGEMTVESAEVYVDTLTLAGHTDWRLPTAHEAFSIMDLAHNNPALDPDAFAPTVAEYWWSSDHQANDANRIWVTNAGGGIGNHLKSETISAGGVKRFHVRAVRDMSAPDTLPSQFIHLQNGFATDTLTGLTWQRAHCPDTLSWENALVYADTLTVGGFTDWRLPNIKELRSICDVALIAPCLDGGVFSNEGARKYWSSTTLQSQPLKAWYVNTQFGISTYDPKTLRHDVRCVRGGDESSTLVQAAPDEFSDGVLSITPNPCGNHCVVRFECDLSDVSINLIDTQGRSMRQFVVGRSAAGRGAIDIDLEGLPEGIYLCHLSSRARQRMGRVMKLR